MFTLSITQQIARITIDRGEKRNAVPMAEWANLERLVRAANISEAVMVVIDSADPASFCAGSDLSELTQLCHDPLKRRKFRGAMESVLGRVRAINKPSIALVSGGCFGTGLSLAAACDLRIARSDASFAITPARFGISYPKDDVSRIMQLVGPGNAARLMYGCETITGTEAYRMGLVEIVDDSAELGREMLDRISLSSPSSLNDLKATMAGRWGVNNRFDAAFGSKDFTTGIESYKRDKSHAKISQG